MKVVIPCSHPELQAMIRAMICDNIDPLILADWLEERSDPRGAEVRQMFKDCAAERLQDDEYFSRYVFGSLWTLPDSEVLHLMCVDHSHGNQTCEADNEHDPDEDAAPEYDTVEVDGKRVLRVKE